MDQIDVAQIEERFALKDATVLTTDGEKVGKVEQVWVDKVNGLPEWAAVRIGKRFGARTRYVPLRAADIGEGEVKVAYTKSEIDSAPEFEPQSAGPGDEERLYRHYRQPLPAPPAPQVRNPFDRLTAVWVPGVAEKAAAYAKRAKDTES